MIRAAFSLVALIPMMTGPLPQAQNTLTVALCSGGEIAIPLGDSDERNGGDGGAPGDCHQQGCHAGTCRPKGKRGASQPSD